jgi:hypothetical protein
VIFSTIACPDLIRLPPLQSKKVTVNTSIVKGQSSKYIDDAKMPLNPSTMIILVPKRDAGRISSSLRVDHSSIALYTVTDFNRCKFRGGSSEYVRFCLPLKCLAIENNLR